MNNLPLSLYVHWPFCKSKCPYCDFNSYVRPEVDENAWHDALLKELDYWGEQTQGRTLQSIFFGGGTPSLMPARTVEAIISRARAWWSAQEEVEITLEANPTSVEANKLHDFRLAGVNRLSLGIQSLRPDALVFLGREHSVEEAKNALMLAAKIFPRFSFDLIYARPQQPLDEWCIELGEALDFGAQHLSLYQLTIEENTRFASLYEQGRFTLPNEDDAARLYGETNAILTKRGFSAYEVSNYAQNGFECQHNLTYWRYQDYIGIGPGAHGRTTLDKQKMATSTHKTPETWLKRVSDHCHGLQETTVLTQDEQLEECLLMGLRLEEGISLAKLAKYNFKPRAEKIRMLTENDLIQFTKTHLKATAEGRLRLNAVLPELI